MCFVRTATARLRYTVGTRNLPRRRHLVLSGQWRAVLGVRVASAAAKPRLCQPAAA